MQDVETKNVFSDAFIDAFIRALDKLEEAHPRVAILHGLEDVFSGGAEKETLDDLASGKLAVKDLILSERIVNTPFPIIAAMEGHAMGGGLTLGLCSDIILMARESRYGAVFMRMGFTPGMGTTTLLREAVGPFIAAEMMYTAKRFRGSELVGRATGVNYILPKKEIMPKAGDIATQIAEKNTKSVYLLKYALSAPKKKLLIDARLQEDMMHTISFGYPETKEIIDEVYGR